MLTKTNRLVKHEILEGKGESVISTTVFSTSVSMDVIKTGWLGKTSSVLNSKVVCL